MASALSKRQQARNEKALQDLVHHVPGNNLCADCHARNPGLFKLLRVFELASLPTDANRPCSLGIMECMKEISPPTGARISSDTDQFVVGRFLMYALCCDTPKARDSYLQSQVAEYGQLVQRAG